MNLSKETAVTGVKRDKTGKVIAFNIDRRIWGRGKRAKDQSGLFQINLNPDGSKRIDMCCLGIYARACGVSTRRLNNVGMPSGIKGTVPKAVKQFIKDEGPFGYDDTELATKLAEANDKLRYNSKFREAKIKEGFASLGIEVTFVGEG